LDKKTQNPHNQTVHQKTLQNTQALYILPQGATVSCGGSVPLVSQLSARLSFTKVLLHMKQT